MNISGFFSELYNQFTAAAISVLTKIINLLPDSPFIFLSQTPEVYRILKVVNWIIPFDFVVSTFSAWLTAIATYYAYSIILRFFKAIE